MPLFSSTSLLAGLLLVALLAGCGQKGPLYLPPPPTASESSPTTTP